MNSIKMAEVLSLLPGAVYVSRQHVLDPGGINRAKKAIKLAFQAQIAGLGFTMVEILSSCPVNWRMKPDEALTWAKENMVPYFPIGDCKVTDEVNELKRHKPAKA